MFDKDEIQKAVVTALIGKIMGNDTTSTANYRSFDDGEKVIIRTVTSIHVGRVVRENPTFVWLDEASWVADTGRYSEALQNGTLLEVEKSTGIKRVAIGSIVDVDVWDHDLPTDSK